MFSTSLRRPFFVILIGLGISAVSMILFSNHHVDLKYYYEWSSAALAGHLPYREFSFEYPPWALVPLVAPRLFVMGATISLPVYTGLFWLENCLILAGFALVLYRNKTLFVKQTASGREPQMWAAVLLAGSPIMFWRYDLFPVLMTLLGLMSVLKNKPSQAGLWLGIGVAAKLYPIVLVPLLVVMYLATGQYVRLARFLGTGLLVLVATTAVVWYWAGPEMGQFLKYHLKRGINIDAVAGSVVTIGHLVTKMPLKVILNYGSANLVTPWELFVVSSLTPLFIMAYLGWMGLSYHSFRSAHRTHQAIAPSLIARSLAVSILLFIIFNKVFSTQYLIWLLPFFIFFPFRIQQLYALSFALTTLIHPFLYPYLLQLNPVLIGLAALKNILVVALLIALLQSLRSRPEPV